MRRVHLGTVAMILLGAAGMAAATARAGDGAGPAKADPPVVKVLVPDLKGPGPEKLLSPDGLQGFVAWVGPGRILTPAVGDRAVFTGTGNQMTAFDALTGRRLWISTTDDGGPTAAAYMGGRVYFNTASCTLYAIDARSGARKWSHWIAGNVVTTPSVSGDRVFVTGPAERGGIKIECLKVSTGAVAFRRALPAEAVSAPVVDGERIYLALVDGSVMALDLSGKTLWTRKGQKALAAPWPEGGRLLVAAGDPARPGLLSLDPNTGKADSRAVATPRDDSASEPTDDRQAMLLVRGGPGNGAGGGGGVGGPGGGLQRQPPSGRGNAPPPPAPPAPPSGTPSAPVNPWVPGLGALGYEGPRPCTASGTVAMAAGPALFLQPLKGGTEQRVDLGEAGFAAGSAVAAGDLFLVATVRGRLLGFDAASGEPRFSVEFRGTKGPILFSSSPSVSRGRAYIGTADGRVLGVDLPDPSADGWPMWGGGAERRR